MNGQNDTPEEVILITLEEWHALVQFRTQDGLIGDLARRAWEDDPFDQKKADRVVRTDRGVGR